MNARVFKIYCKFVYQNRSMRRIACLLFLPFLLLSCGEPLQEDVTVILLQPTDSTTLYWKDSLTVQANILNAKNLSSYKIQLKGEHKDTFDESFIAFNTMLQVGTINQVNDLSVLNTFSIPELILPGPYTLNFYVLTNNGAEVVESNKVLIRSSLDEIAPTISIQEPVQHQVITGNTLQCKATIADQRSDLADGKIHFICVWIKSMNNTNERYLIKKWNHSNSFENAYNPTTKKLSYTFNKPAKITHPGNFKLQIEARDEFFNTFLVETDIEFQ